MAIEAADITPHDRALSCFTVLQRHGQRLGVIYFNYLANDAHVVTVDPGTGRSSFPVLGASGGHPAVLVCELT